MPSRYNGELMANQKILIVGDDDAVRQDMRAAVERGGYEVAGVASAGADALLQVDSLNPDLVLMDSRLEGEMDGFEAAGEIRRRFEVPVICLTVVEDGAARSWAKEAGPLSCLLKPVIHTELKNAVEVGLYKHRMERELRKAKQAAESADRAKTAFLATVSHELRTPMNGVLGMTELLLMSDMEEPYRENVRLIKDSAMGLLSVLNQILDYSKLETSDFKIRMTDFRLEDIVAGVLSRYNRAAKAKGINLGYSLSPAIPIWLRGDLAKLRQILGNLVNNAVKFTRSGQILVDVTPMENGEGVQSPTDGEKVFVQMLVQDSGMGIPKEKMNEIFESFSLAQDHLLHATGALGLGLAVVSRLTAALGGTVTCSSVEGKGSTFSVCVPLEPSSYETLAPSEAVMGGDSPIQGAHILVVEDDLVNQRYIVRLLEKMGCTVTLAEDGLEAIEVLKAERFDVVFMDVEMPRMNGIEATRAIRDRETGCLDPRVPIVALTAHAMWGDEQRCVHAGMDDYVSKPVEIDTMAAIIQSILGSR